MVRAAASLTYILYVSKLTPDQVRDIYTSEEPYTAIADRFGVSLSTVKGVRYGRNYAEVTADLEKPRRRRGGKLTADQAREAYTSPDSAPVVAARLGVPVSWVNHVRYGYGYKSLTRGFAKPQYVRKLARDQVREIFLSEENTNATAKRHGVSHDVVKKIRNRTLHAKHTEGLTVPVPERRWHRLKPSEAQAIFLSRGRAAVVATRYGVSPGTVQQIRERKRWARATEGLSKPPREWAGLRLDMNTVGEVFTEKCRDAESRRRLAYRYHCKPEHIQAVWDAPDFPTAIRFIADLQPQQKARGRPSEYGLSEKQVREAYVSPDIAPVVAARFGVPVSLIRSIRKQESYRAITASLRRTERSRGRPKGEIAPAPSVATRRPDDGDRKETPPPQQTLSLQR